MYKFEVHLHTCGCSACAVSTANQMLDAAKEKNYSGIVITNHFYHGNTCVDRNLDWENFINEYKQDYLSAKKYGEKLDIKVFFGLEEGFAPGKEMLFYGLEPEFYINHPEIIMMSAKEKSKLIRSNGGIVICAHPFRDRSYIPNPNAEPDISLFDGIEVYNHFNKPEENIKALEFAQKNGLIKTSGCDIHNHKYFGNGGLDFNCKIETYRDFIENLKNGNYSLIIP